MSTWERLADLKESYPVQVAEYAKAVGIHGEPAFAWWVEHVLKKRDRIIAKVVKRWAHLLRLSQSDCAPYFRQSLICL